MFNVNIYVDGSCLGNPGPAGIGIVLSSETVDKEVSIPIIGCGTNILAELTAAIKGLELLNFRPITNVIMYTDSQTVIGWAMLNWKATSHTDLVRKFKDLIAECKSFKIKKVSKTDQIPQHFRSHELAQEAAAALKESIRHDK
ncbi:MAG TPA: RNase H family protein [Methanosarcinales archaeon]|nr:RNase H family protein [Methanosarcinales archaeon]